MNDLAPQLVQSFAENRGSRGVHFYDASNCEFLQWDEVMGGLKESFPDTFYDKLIEAVANYDPDNEFITVSAGDGQLTIELFKAHEM